MSESDSGVDTGSESNESNSMSVESPPHSDEDKEVTDFMDKLHSAGLSYQNIENVGFQIIAPICCSYGFGEYRRQEHKLKIKHRLQRRNALTCKDIYPKMKDVIGERRLRAAANADAFEIVRNLLDNGVDPCSADDRQRTALHFAACRGHTAIAQLLIDRGADVNQRDIVGNTPLHLAACTSHIEMVTLLLKAGTNLNALDNSGRSPIDLAKSKLKLLQINKSYSSMQLKMEVVDILEMMLVYLMRSGKQAELGYLNAFSNRLHHHQTREEVHTDVEDLLSSIAHLSL